MRVPQPLTNTKINATRPGASRQVLCDGGARGLYLVTAPKPSGRRTWEFRYVSPATKKQSSVTLGSYPALGISDARRKAEEQRALLERGQDPAAEKKKSRVETGLTLESVAKAWDASRDGGADEHTRHTAMRRLEMYVLPTLGGRSLRSVTQAEIAAALDAIKAAGQPDTANRVCSVLSMMYRWAIARGDVDRDVAAIVKKNYPKAAQGHYAAITHGNHTRRAIRRAPRLLPRQPDQPGSADRARPPGERESPPRESSRSCARPDERAVRCLARFDAPAIPRASWRGI